MGDINQDDIDKLLAGAIGDDFASGETPKAETAAEAAGPVGQDDIDAMFASLGDSDNAAPAAPAPPAEPAASEPEKPPESEAPGNDLGVANQDDIDAIFAALGESSPPPPKPQLEPQAAEPPPPPPPSEVPPEPEDALASHSDFAALLGSPDTASETKADDEKTTVAQEDSGDLDGLLSTMIDNPQPQRQPSPPAAHDTVRIDTVDMDELLRQISSAAPPRAELPSEKHPAPSPLFPVFPADQADSAAPPPEADFPELRFPAEEGRAPFPAPSVVPAPEPPPAGYAPPRIPAAAPENLSVMASAGEVESIAGQISGMLGQLSEKAQRYMQAWLSSDAEAKNLRNRLLAEERHRASLGGEKDALRTEVEQLRDGLARAEGEKLGLEEARRNGEASLQARVRELESRAAMLDSEVESLKNELTRARTQATGVDIESRRARFEAERLKSEAESERMERLRIQRALENREKEFQAVQAQASGQASSLFIDELHRLVRRLESELDARTAGGHEALNQLDRLEVSETMVPIAANLRAALMRAIGDDAGDADDAIKSLGREAARVRGPRAIESDKTEVLSFETALSVYNFGFALDIAGALLREFKTTPGALMRRAYQCPALRRSEVGEHLAGLARLLEGLRTVQESADRARGRESAESEVFYVQMFDFLHNLVRLKVVTRLAGDPWRLFLDLRGRFSFVTSDKQWTEYRDGVLGSATAKS